MLVSDAPRILVVNTGRRAFARALHALVPDLEAGVEAIGHRIVHGGRRFTSPVVMSPPVLAALRGLSSLALDHLPQAIEAAETLPDAAPSIHRLRASTRRSTRRCRRWPAPWRCRTLVHFVERGATTAERQRLVNRESGLLALSGVSSDMQQLMIARHTNALVLGTPGRAQRRDHERHR